jgi:hypothetical protein
VALAATSLALSLGAAEIALRGWYAWQERADVAQVRTGEGATRVHTTYLGHIVRMSSSPELFYELKPNLTGTFYGRPLTTNASGMRMLREPPVAKPPGTVAEIVGVGRAGRVYPSRPVTSSPSGELTWKLAIAPWRPQGADGMPGETRSLGIAVRAAVVEDAARGRAP